MKKTYSKKAGKEVFAIAPEQLEIFKKFGYQTPQPEAVIADAAAALIVPPEGTRAYVVFNFMSGEFAVRVKSCTLKGNAASALVGEIVKAGIVKGLAEKADPDRPKTEQTASSSPLAAILTEAIKKAAAGAAEKATVEESEEVSG